MTRNDDDLIKVGQEALARLHLDSTFDDWILVGQALKIGRAEVETTSKISGGTYQAKMAAWLEAQGFHTIDKGVRSRLLKIIDDLPNVLAWREKLPVKQRLNLNHPNAVWRKFHAPDKPKVKRTTPGSSPFPLAERNKLAKILGMLGSDQSGIVGSAIIQAKRLLDKHHLSWFDVLAAPGDEQTKKAA